MAASPLTHPFTNRGLGHMTQRKVVELPAQILLELTGGLVPSRRVWLQAVSRDRGHGGRDRWVRSSNIRDRSQAVGDHLRQDRVDFSFTDRKRVNSGQELVEDHAQSENVAPGIDRLARCHGRP